MMQSELIGGSPLSVSPNTLSNLHSPWTSNTISRDKVYLTQPIQTLPPISLKYIIIFLEFYLD